MKKLLSFHSDEQLKTDLIEEIKRHELADQIVQGHYGKENGKWKGCAVGCSIHSYNLVRGKNLATSVHALYESKFGIPRILARLEDRIFEGMNIEDAKGYPYRFMSAIPVGKDLDPVWKKFFIYILTDKENDQTRKAIQDVSDLLNTSLISKVTPEQFRAVASAARSARSAYAAAADDDAADARSKSFKRMADKLVELLAAA